MLKIAARPHVLQGEQIAAFMMYAGEAVADELLGDVGQPIAVALLGLFRGKGGPLAHFVDHVHRPVRNAAVECAARVAVESSARRIGRVLVDVRHLQRLAVVESGVAAAMMDHNRMVLGDLIQIVNIEQAIVLHLGVVEEKPFHPCARRRLLGFRAEFLDDAVDSDEFDYVGIAD